MAAYRSLRAMDQLRPQDRELMTKLIATRAPIGAIQSLFDDIGHPLKEMGKLLHRAGVPGLLMLEYEIETRDTEAAALRADTQAWMQLRPDSTLAAIRYVDHWSSLPKPAATSTSGIAPVPRQIVQYWNSPTPPQPIRDMVRSWASAPGFAHTLMDRTAALTFLKDNCDPHWRRAFLLAENHAEEADFLRLCVLAKKGGVYADADDVLYGALDDALCLGTGLIVYRETMGGAVGNNFIAAPAEHPVITMAAQLTRDALLQRSREVSWSKTGPGLLTRALGHYLATADAEQAAATVTVLERGQLERCIAMHNRLNYKQRRGHWATDNIRRKSQTPLWTGVGDILAGLAETAD